MCVSDRKVKFLTKNKSRNVARGEYFMSEIVFTFSVFCIVFDRGEAKRKKVAVLPSYYYVHEINNN